MLKFEKKTCI